MSKTGYVISIEGKDYELPKAVAELFNAYVVENDTLRATVSRLTAELAEAKKEATDETL